MDISVQCRMRSCKKTNRGETSNIMKLAAEIVLLEGKTVRSVTKQFNVCHMSLPTGEKQKVANNQKSLTTVIPGNA